MFRVTLLIFILSLVFDAGAQEKQTDIKKYNTVVIAGKRYIIHIVKRNETLFNISKVYGVPYDSITKFNPLIVPTSLEVGLDRKSVV